MTSPIVHQPDARLDLVFERIVDVPPELVWRAWTTPSILMKWFTPAPWTHRRLRNRPSSRWHLPHDDALAGRSGIPQRRLLPRDRAEPETGLDQCAGARLPPRSAGRRASGVEFSFTAVISLEPSGSGTKYTALVIHGDEEGRKQHEAMGFHDGWGKALDQLLALVKQPR